jgi:hypothetical protein
MMPGIVGAVLISAFAIGCGGNGGGSTGSTPPADISGAWTLIESFTDHSLFSCEDTSAVTITQSGTPFTGSVIRSGSCDWSGISRDNSGTVTIPGGAVYTATLNFGAPVNAGQTGLDFTCTYNGNLYHTPVDSIAGRMRCGTQGLIDGTWVMTR